MLSPVGYHMRRVVLLCSVRSTRRWAKLMLCSAELGYGQFEINCLYYGRWQVAWRTYWFKNKSPFLKIYVKTVLCIRKKGALHCHFIPDIRSSFMSVNVYTRINLCSFLFSFAEFIFLLFYLVLLFGVFVSVH